MKRRAIAQSIESLHQEIDGVDGYVFLRMEDGACVVAPSLSELAEVVETYIDRTGVGIAGKDFPSNGEVLSPAIGEILHFETIDDLLQMTGDDVALIDLIIGSISLKGFGIAKISVRDWKHEEIGELFGDKRIGMFLRNNGCGGDYCSRIQYGKSGWSYIAGQNYPSEISDITRRFKREFDL